MEESEKLDIEIGLIKKSLIDNGKGGLVVELQRKMLKELKSLV